MEIMNGIIILLIVGIAIFLQIKKYRLQKQGKELKIDQTIDEFCNRHYKKIWCIWLVIIFITVIYQFGSLPSFMGVDEAGMAYDAYCIANYGTDRYLNSFPLYLTNFGSGQSTLCCYLAVFFIKIIGDNMIAYRLPALLIYLLGLVASYLLVSRAKDKKTALLFTFIIITCPWNILTAREALDCNLYAGMFMISLFLMQRAQKNYQYVIAGVIVGITLYTYCLSWITLPLFLVVWSIYMLYTKKVKMKQLILMAIPIFIFAIPLIYFLLLNSGIVEKTQIGIFTFPILQDFRIGQISLDNIGKTGLESLIIIFFTKQALYFVYVPLFIIGFIISVVQTYKKIKKKEYNITTVFVIAFITLLLGLLCTDISSPNRANVVYIPILYFVTIAILAIAKYSKWIWITCFICISILCVDFEIYYYSSYVTYPERKWFSDKYLMPLTIELEKKEEIKSVDKYFMVEVTSPYIYTVLATKMSPYDFMDSWEEIDFYGIKQTRKVGNYYYYNYYSHKREFEEIDFRNQKAILIISKIYEDVVEIMDKRGYEKKEYGDVYLYIT